MKSRYKLAIAIPTYNRSEILNDILWIVGPQIQKFHPEVACFIIDNNSTDNTAEIVQEHAARWGFVHYVKNNSNVGLVRNIANAIHIPDSEWVWLLGDDDVPLPWGVGELLRDIADIEREYGDVTFLAMSGGKIDDQHRLKSVSPDWEGCPSKVLTIYDQGGQIAGLGIHSLAWLSKLAINRKYWNQLRFDEIYRETDLYTFVSVLVEASFSARSAHTKKLYVLATDRGSRGYYFSKAAIARVCEFPEIELKLVQKFGMRDTRKLLSRSRKGCLLERALFAIKIGVFDEEYAKQLKYLARPISPFMEERLLLRAIFLTTRIPLLKNFLRAQYLKRKVAAEQKIGSINSAS